MDDQKSPWEVYKGKLPVYFIEEVETSCEQTSMSITPEQQYHLVDLLLNLVYSPGMRDEKLRAKEKTIKSSILLGKKTIEHLEKMHYSDLMRVGNYILAKTGLFSTGVSCGEDAYNHYTVGPTAYHLASSKLESINKPVSNLAESLADDFEDLVCILQNLSDRQLIRSMTSDTDLLKVVDNYTANPNLHDLRILRRFGIHPEDIEKKH